MSASAVFASHSNKCKGLNCIIMCPSHLTPNWKKEIEKFIPNSKAYIIEGLKGLKAIESILKDKLRVSNVFVIISKETAKLDYSVRPCAIWKDYHPIYNPYTSKYEVGRGVFICPDCGQVLTKTIKEEIQDPNNTSKLIKVNRTIPLEITDFIKSANKEVQRCSNKIKKYNDKKKEIELITCNASIWEPSCPSDNGNEWIKLKQDSWIMKRHLLDVIDELGNLEVETKESKQLSKILMEYACDEDKLNEKICNKFNYKYAIAKYIKKHMKNTFGYFIGDEIHELAGEDTLQGKSFHLLTKSAKKTIGLTGTILNGYAKSIYYTLFRLYPSQMRKEGFHYGDIAAFSSLYGVSSRTSNVSIDRNGVERVKKSKTRDLPGVSPLVYTKFLLNNTIFVSLEDMTEGLPPYEETPVPVQMDDDLYEAYRDVLLNFNETVSVTQPQDKSAIIKQFTNSLLEYCDAPHYKKEIYNKRLEESVYTAPLLEKTYRNKELRLLSLVRNKVNAGEKVLIYYQSINTTDIGNHLVSMFKENDLNSALLKSGGKAKDRIERIESLLENGADILITNPELVKTGLNLIEFTTIIFYQTGYKLDTMRQASRRSWRLSQKNPVNVYFMYYEGTAQETCLSLMASKLMAAQSIEGKFSSEGLKALSGSQNILTEIANNVCNNIKNTVDPNLFKASTFVKKSSNKVREHSIPLDNIEIKISSNGRSESFNFCFRKRENYIIDEEIKNNLRLII